VVGDYDIHRIVFYCENISSMQVTKTTCLIKRHQVDENICETNESTLEIEVDSSELSALILCVKSFRNAARNLHFPVCHLLDRFALLCHSFLHLFPVACLSLFL